ncbi:MAG TPA: chromosome partitioning protein ParA [Firmicutes bacterium]|nr:chromosome partitioning protein ParA [Bacillota bacterium]
MSIQNDIRNAIEALIDPVTNKTLKETHSLTHLSVDEENSVVTAIIKITVVKGDAEKTISRQVAKIVKLDYGFKGVKLQFEELPPQTSTTTEDKKTIYIAITSGKGGVGKSTVTANLAVALNRLGKKVGIIDADIYGPSIPHLFEMANNGFDVAKDNKIFPPKALNIPIISTEFFLENDKPLMWRGPMLQRMLNHFFNDVAWDHDIEYMLIDLPPGTGDVAMDIQKIIPEAHVIVVTTPHPTASHIAIKSGYAAQSLKHNILGVVENMSYYINPANNEHDAIFGSGGGDLVANQLNVPLLTQLPIGQPKDSHSIYGMNEQTGILYLGLANKVLKALK